MKLNAREYDEAIDRLLSRENYLFEFEFEFPQGLNNLDVLLVARALTETDDAARQDFVSRCIAGKTVIVRQGEKSSQFVLSGGLEGLNGIDFFIEQPLAVLALTNAVWGHFVKKSIPPLTETAENDKEQ